MDNFFDPFRHGKCPSSEQTTTFIRVTANFLSKNPNKKIAVHCTHGFNRTGFMICSFLVEIENWSVDAAIDIFAKSRSPGIYKQDYLDELTRIYDENRIEAPPLPDWCYENEVINADVHQSTQDNDYPNKRTNYQRQPQQQYSSSQNDSNSLQGINGIYKVTDSREIVTLQNICTDYCKYDRKGFPGCQPVSLTCNNISFLCNEYMVSWKADGNRYLMLILSTNQMFFFDRDYNVFQLHNVSFFDVTLSRNLKDTLLDGEMVIDIVDNKKVPRFLIYDIVYCDGEDVSSKNFRERLNLIFKHIIKPREKAKQTGRIDRTKEPIGIRIKDFFEIKQTKKFFEPKFQSHLSHEIDGLIFQPVHLGYLAGRCYQVLKWKPPSHNSVDFHLKIIKETRPDRVESFVGQLYVLNQDRPFGEIRVNSELRKYNDRIIECRFNMEKRCWEFMRERTDKSLPNALRTANNVFESICNPITLEYLLFFIDKNSKNPSK